MTPHRATTRTMLLAATALAGALVLPVEAAVAEQRQYSFDLPAQPLDAALRTYAKTANQQVIFAGPDVLGRTSAPLSGTYSPEEALQILLAGSELTVRRTPEGVLQIAAATDPQSGSAAGDGAEGTVDALIVTAQKREEDIQDVPIAISAFSQEALETHQIAGGPDLITQVPNMTFTKTNFSSYSVQLRGIGTQAISATTDPGVAVAFNNTPFIQNRFFEQEFYDLQRVEVLRGPQGTLYGRNATAGVVNIISQKPKFVAEAKLSGDLANYSSTRVEGMVNIPLVEDKAALRLAGAWTKREGYATNELTGNPIDGRDLWSTRVSLRFAPTDALDANLIWEHFEEDDDRLRSGKQLCDRHVVTEVNGVPTPNFNTPLLDAGAPRDFGSVQSLMSQGCERVSLYSPDAFQTPNGAMIPYYIPLGAIGLPTSRYDPYVSTTQSQDLRVIESTIDPKYRAKADVGELQVSWDFTDALTLASETAYAADVVWSMQDFNRFNTLPGAWDTNSATTGGFLIRNGILREDGFFCDPQLGCSDRLVAVDLSTAESRQFSQELRLSSDFDGPLNFSLGANFLRFDLEAKYYVFFNSLTLSRLGDQFGSFTLNNPPLNPWIPGVSDNRQCAGTGIGPGEASTNYGYTCIYVEPNSIENIQDLGHNYFLSKNPYRLISYAVFGEAYYNITDSLKLTGGLRWTVDKKHAPRIPTQVLNGQGHSGFPVLEILEQEWREPTGRLALDWKPELAFTDETLLYASYAHGYKAGGANPPPVAGLDTLVSATRPITFEAEFVDAFELGSKNTLADRAVTLNLAAFYYDYTGYQISEIVDRSAFNRNVDAEVWGLEIEADWRPLENLKLSFKGGYENTRIADGEEAIDLMDRTAGTPGWTIVRPFPTYPSSCVLPEWLFNFTSGGQFPQASGGLAGLGAVGGGGPGGCELAYIQGVDPMTGMEYVPYPTQSESGTTLYNWPTGEGTPGAYPGFNPFDESVYRHNRGEGFMKPLGGNELPNAPNFTATLSADYTVPLPHEWLATLHTDLYWQSEAWWRIFNDHEFNKLDEYFTMNIAAIFANEDAGWRVMAYVKNVFDRDSITGAFLNSDDTALTTNVFLTEPRLYGLRVTKEWTGVPWLDFGQRREGPYPFEIEIGGQVQRHDAPYQATRPDFLDEFSAGLDPTEQTQNQELDWGDGRELKLTWRPGAPWSVSASLRYGRTNGGNVRTHREEAGDTACVWSPSNYLGKYEQCNPQSPYYEPTAIRYSTNWSDATASNQEEHLLADFEVGRDVGLGLLGDGKSSLAAGLRYAQFESHTHLWMEGIPNWDLMPGAFEKYTVVTDTSTTYLADLEVEREFEGAGPVLSWDAAKRLLGNEDVGHVDIDWSIGGGALFGEQTTSVIGEQSVDLFVGSAAFGAPTRTSGDAVVTPVVEERSRSVTVPFADLSLGLSYTLDRLSIGAGYRWERYYDVLDAGDVEAKDFDRTIDGPYFKLSVGFGG